MLIQLGAIHPSERFSVTESAPEFKHFRTDEIRTFHCRI